ncbi:MAG: hypothetical protein U9R47_07035, partial [Actinomycetota bacterium]|nr:hypothetical protein [Actinomycetota bacterium]
MKTARHLRLPDLQSHTNEATAVTANEPRVRSLRYHAIAWGLVAVQAVLIIGILLMPVGNDWPLPTAGVIAATALTWIGIALVIWAILVFGRGVTPSP